MMALGTSVTVLGTGLMGAPVVRAVCTAGFDVRMWNRSTARAAVGTRYGATDFDSPSEAVTGADVVVTVLLDGQAVDEVASAWLPYAPVGSVWIQMSTIAPAETAKLAARSAKAGVEFVDAPVLGGPDSVGTTLTVLAAGRPHARERARPVLEAVARRIVCVAETAEDGDATRLKLLVNNWIIVSTAAAAQAAELATAVGLPVDVFLDALGSNGSVSPLLHDVAHRVRDRAFEADFTMDAALKDVRLILSLAQSEGVALPLTDTLSEVFAMECAAENGLTDISAVFSRHPKESG